MKNKGRSWYSIEAKAGNKEADVFIYDTVGIWGVEANTFVRELNEIDVKTINLRINSPGGNVFDGVAIFNALKKHDAKVITHIEALAASIASIIALAGDEVHIADNAFYMIHNPYTWAVGDAASMRKTAGMLDKVTDSLIKTYTNKTGKASAEIRQLMDAETWFTAEEAKDAGFADVITDEEIIEAAFDLSVFNNVPTQVFNTLNATKPSTRKLEHALREVGGLSKADAKAVVAKGYNALNHRDDGKGEGHREDGEEILNLETEEVVMDKNQFKNEHSALHTEVVADARKGYVSDADVDAKVVAGVTAEKERILALDKLSADMPGYEELIGDLKADGKTTAAEASLQVIAAHGEKLKGIAAQQAADAAASGINKVPVTDGGEGEEVAKNFEALVADYMVESNCSKGKAIKAVARSNKKEHADYIAAQNKGVENV